MLSAVRFGRLVGAGSTAQHLSSCMVRKLGRLSPCSCTSTRRGDGKFGSCCAVLRWTVSASMLCAGARADTSPCTRVCTSGWLLTITTTLVGRCSRCDSRCSGLSHSSVGCSAAAVASRLSVACWEWLSTRSRPVRQLLYMPLRTEASACLLRISRRSHESGACSCGALSPSAGGHPSKPAPSNVRSCPDIARCIAVCVEGSACETARTSNQTLMSHRPVTCFEYEFVFGLWMIRSQH